MSKTLYDKIWEKHVIIGEKNELQLVYVDMHYIHEVTSPQAFEGLDLANRKVRRPDKTFATMDHNTPTIKEDRYDIVDKVSKAQLDALRDNCERHGINLVGIHHEDNGIVHIIGPELGLTLPGSIIVCGDSHTATHGAFGAIAFGIGTSEVEHVFATQTIWQKKLKNMKVEVVGKLRNGVYSKDIILGLLKEYGVSMGAGCAIEFCGEVIENMSMEERMTISNMAIEGGAKVGIIAPDEKTFEYIKGRKYAPKDEKFEEKVRAWKELYTDVDAVYDKEIVFDVSKLKPQITWGTNPGMTVDVDDFLPSIEDENDKKAYEYMGLDPGQKLENIKISHVFIGSCTNGRYSDLLEVAKRVKGKKIANHIKGVIVPGSRETKRRAEEEGLDKIFIESGFEWREPGCSTCLGMNPDLIPENEHCLSTSNRNFEGRQGKNARTHLVSPAMAAACAIAGKIIDISSIEELV